MTSLSGSLRSAADPGPPLTAVVPAGGSGTRLWPLSTPARPKFLLDLRGRGASMLQETVERLAPVAARTLVVTGAPHAEAVRAQLPGLAEGEVLAEPSPRDSMAAIALAAAVIEHRHGPGVLGSFAADHVIRDVPALHAAVRAAVAAAEAGKVVTIGIQPHRPETGFGYIRAGAALPGLAGAHAVEAFTEKPDAERAAAFLAAGGHYWNAGMYVVRTDVLLGHLDRLMPELAEGVRVIAAAWDGPGRDAALAEGWSRLTRIAIDHAIAEPVAAEGGVAVVPADLGWDDVGDFASLAAVLEQDATQAGAAPPQAIGRTAPVLAVEAARPLVIGGDRPVAVVGLEDVVVVDAPHALLVLARSHAQHVKQAAERLATEM